MNLEILNTRRLCGTVTAPPSKSYTHRAVMIAGLNGKTAIVNPSVCDDALNTVEVWKALGAEIERAGDRLLVSGFGGRPCASEVNVGEAGTLLRFLLPVAAMAGGRIRVSGQGSLLRRPNREIVGILRDWGVDIAGQGAEHCLPIEIAGAGGLRGGPALIDASRSSQTVSALLIAAPFAQQDVVLTISGRLVSRPYVDITIDALQWAGIEVERGWDERGRERFCVEAGKHPAPRSEFVVHGDWSGAAFLMAAACLVESDIAITDLVDDRQGDRKIVGILKSMGADIEWDGNRVAVRGPASLRGVEIDCADCPDLAPVLTALACFAEGTTRICNAAHLAIKESNRLAEPAGQLNALGADARFADGEIVIKGRRPQPGKVSSCGDHRVAMALAVAGVGIGGGITIGGSDAIAKSYPGFVKDLAGLGALIRES